MGQEALTPRLPGLDGAALSRLLEELEEEVIRYVDTLDLRHAGAFAMRAHVRFAAGAPPDEVLDDLWMASRCLISDPAMHLARTPPERLLTRRISPIEVALLGGQPELAARLAGALGLPLAAGLAGVADEALMEELGILSPGLVGKPLTRPEHLMGLAAAVWAGALSAAARGFEDEALMALSLLARARYDGPLEPQHRAVMMRYGGLCEGLLEILRPDERDLEGIIADQLERFTAQLLAAPAQAGPRRFMDTGALSLVALALLAGRTLGPMPPRPDITPLAMAYTELLEAMTEGLERRAVEAPSEAPSETPEAAQEP